MALNLQRNWEVRMAEDLQKIVKTSRHLSIPTRAGRLDVDSNSVASIRFVELPDEILLAIFSYLNIAQFDDIIKASQQRDLHACSLVSTQWNAVSTPLLYQHPLLQGASYDLFTRTICPSINLHIKKSELSHFVQTLNLNCLVHHGSKSTTARLLGRTKGSLTRFVAPQASFSLNCYPALSKCRQLQDLDLSLVSDSGSMRTLFDSVAKLDMLEYLHLPRSSGYGDSVAAETIVWPPTLKALFIAGGLDAAFWMGEFHFPPTLGWISVTHCPKLSTIEINAFILTLSCATRPGQLQRMTFAYLPALDPTSLDEILWHLPWLTDLSVSVDYVSPDMFQPPQTPRWMQDDVEMSGLSLKTLSLTDSGNRGDPQKFFPDDVVPEDMLHVHLTTVNVDPLLGWQQSAYEDQIESLEFELEEMNRQAARLGNKVGQGLVFRRRL